MNYIFVFQNHKAWDEFLSFQQFLKRGLVEDGRQTDALKAIYCRISIINSVFKKNHYFSLKAILNQEHVVPLGSKAL